MTKREAAELMLRESEGRLRPEDMADLLIGPAAVDLGTVPPTEWDKLLCHSVKLPDAISHYVDGQNTFTRAELDAIEDQLTTHYSVMAPYYIQADPGPPFDAWLMKEV